MALSKKVNIKYNVDARGAKRGLDSLKKGTEEVRKSAKGSTDELRRMGQGAGGAGKGIGGLSSKMQGLQTAAASTAAAVAAVGLGFLKVAETAAESQVAISNLPFAINKARGATMGLVDDLTLQQNAITANRLGVSKSEEDFARLSSAATKLGLSVGQDASKSVQDLTTALARQSPMILDNLGITLKVSEANQLYAQRIGKVASELTDAEKKQAFMTIGLERAEQAAAGVNIKLDQSAQFMLELKTQAINAGRYLSRGFVGAMSNASNALQDFIADVTGLNSELADLDAANGGRQFSFFNDNFAANVERAKELERSRREQLALAKENAEIADEVAAFERQGFSDSLRSIELKIAGTTNQGKLNTLLSKEAELKALILEMDGRQGEADALRYQDQLRALRANARRRSRSGGNRDPHLQERLEFQQQLTESINAERQREFAQATTLQRNYLADVQAYQMELAAARQPEIDRFKLANAELERRAELEANALQRQLEMAQINGDPAEAFALEQEQFLVREAALERQLELETQVGERQRIEDELSQVRHEKTISRIQEERRAREEAQKAIADAIRTVSEVEQSGLQLTQAVAGASIKNAERQRAAMAGIQAGHLVFKGGVSIAEGAIAIAAGNVPQGLAQIAAGSAAIVKAGTLAASVGASARGGGGASSTAGTATQFARGPQSERADFNVDRGAPLSIQEGVEGNPNNTGGQSRASGGSRTVNIQRIDVLGSIDDESALKIGKGIKRAEANLGV